MHRVKCRIVAIENGTRNFADKMRLGNVFMATRSLTVKEEASGVLSMTSETLQTMKTKHPDARIAPQKMNFSGTLLPSHHVVFEHVTGDVGWKHSIHIYGVTGPSGMDAEEWKTFPSKNIFGNVAVSLRNVRACLEKKIASKNCQNLEALTACSLSQLDKKPACRPTEIAKVLRRTVGKVVMGVVKDDVKKAVGNLQVSAGQQAG